MPCGARQPGFTLLDQKCQWILTRHQYFEVERNTNFLRGRPLALVLKKESSSLLPQKDTFASINLFHHLQRVPRIHLFNMWTLYLLWECSGIVEDLKMKLYYAKHVVMWCGLLLVELYTYKGRMIWQNIVRARGGNNRHTREEVKFSGPKKKTWFYASHFLLAL